MRGRKAWSRKLGALMMALALCLGVLPATALATGENSWKHTSHDNGWTELTANALGQNGYSLSTGKYYLSGTDYGGGTYFLDLKQTIVIPSGANVVLCLHNTNCTPAMDYETYSPLFKVAAKVEQGGTLTICDCSPTDSQNIYNNYLDGGGGVGGEGPAIENSGTLNIVSGIVGYTTGPAIVNNAGGTINLAGVPELMPYGDGNTVIQSAGTISASYNGTPYIGNTVVIEFTGEIGGTVVTNVTADNSGKFVGPGNTAFAYDSANETLTSGTPVELGSLMFAGQQVAVGVPYNVVNSSKEDTSGTAYTATLVESTTEDDFDMLWDEESNTLTLNNANIVASVDTFSNREDGLFSIASENGIAVNLIGENTITIYSHFDGIERAAYGIKNTVGGVIVDGEEGASLKISMHPGTNNTADQKIAAISATGKVENRTNLTAFGAPGDFVSWAEMVGISSDAFQNEGTFTANISGAHKVYAVQTEDFTNTGTFTANISDASTACALYTGNFANSGALDVGFTGVGNGVGVQLIGGTSFENSGKIDIAIPDADSARGIGRYSTSGTQVDNDFSWTNTESGVITVDVSGEGNATAALGGQTLAGMDLRSGEDITFTNHGTITATAASNGPAALKETNWPSWQYFDTLGILLLCDEGTFTNTGDMKLTALNGYTAGISIGGTNDYDISITNSGNLNITTTTKGGDNIRSVGIYAQIPGIESGAARELPFNTTGGTVSISTSAVDGSTVDSGKLMAICLVQTFTAGTTVPSDTGAFQQITGEGMALSGQPVVLKVENDGKNQTAFINTIGTVSEDGTVTPATDMTVVPSITGTVTIQGTPQVGSTLTAQVSGLPDGVSVTYQWQAADSAEGPFTNIQGATESTYTPTNDQVGQYLRVVVKPVGEDYGGALTATTTQAVVKPYIPPANPNYKITVEATQGGTVVVTPTSAKAGTTVTLTPVPDQGFALDTLTVTDRFGDAVRVTEQADGTHTFTMPNGQVTVTATFTETAPEPLPFTDVAEGDWFYDAVRYAYENGLMDGVGGNRFAPNSATTRAQLVTILYRLEGQPAVSGDLPFTDVETGTWYTNAVLWAAQNNIVNGVSDTEFAPGDDLTRQQLVTILYRYAEAKGYDVSASADLSGYPDAGQVQDYAQPAMAWAVAEGIVEGMDGNLNPAGNASRAQIATILMRFCEDAAQ